jgi:hypothetical protein
MRKALIPAFLLVVAAIVLGSTLFREQLAQAATPFTNVIVGNTTSNPVPVAVQNTDTSGNINVHEQGTANVNVTNTPTVSVANSAANPLDVSNVNDGRNPYTDYENDSTSSGSFLNFCFAAVPSGKTLVLETTAVQIKVPVGIGVPRPRQDRI